MTEADSRWFGWQHEHAEALAALQEAQRAYHRTIAGSAFSTRGDERLPSDVQRETLEALEAARVRLDRIRARRPNM